MADVSEETPLLADSNVNLARKKHEEIYDRFSEGRKRVIVALVSWCGLIPRQFSSCLFLNCGNNQQDSASMYSLRVGFFLPSSTGYFPRDGCKRGSSQVSPRISSSSPKDVISLISTSYLVIDADLVFSLAISLSVFAASIGALVAAAYSGYCKCNSYALSCTLDRASHSFLLLGCNLHLEPFQ
jgi:hypothetical protein